MAERLTECIDSHLLDNGEIVKEYSLNSKIKLNHFSCMDIPNAVYDKLGELEDIMEKYGIESVEELDMKLANFDNFTKGNKFETIEDLQNALNGKFIEVFDEKNKIWKDMVKNLTKTEQDRDTWKRACELACEREDDCYVYDNIHRAYEFYQQAKTEGNNE